MFAVAVADPQGRGNKPEPIAIAARGACVRTALGGRQRHRGVCMFDTTCSEVFECEGGVLEGERRRDAPGHAQVTPQLHMLTPLPGGHENAVEMDIYQWYGPPLPPRGRDPGRRQMRRCRRIFVDAQCPLVPRVGDTFRAHVVVQAQI